LVFYIGDGCVEEVVSEMATAYWRPKYLQSPPVVISTELLAVGLLDVSAGCRFCEEGPNVSLDFIGDGQPIVLLDGRNGETPLVDVRMCVLLLIVGVKKHSSWLSLGLNSVRKKRISSILDIQTLFLSHPLQDC
jgi:hypothetical protein